MKFNKISKKLAACSLAGAMMVSMMGMSVCAAGVTANSNGTPVTSVPVNKTVTTKDNVYAPKTTFTFTVKPVGATTLTDEDGNSVDVKAGVADGLKVDTGAEFEPNTAADTDTTYTPAVGKKASLKTDATKFKTYGPGIYHYEVSEVNGGYEGITYDTTVYDVYVYVSAKLSGKDATEDLYVSGVLSTKSVKDESGKSKTVKSDLNFTNAYDGVHSVTVTKKVQGGFANVNDTFAFSVGVTGADGKGNGEIYVVKYTKKSEGKTETAKVESGKSISIELGKDDTVTIYGLTKSDVYTIKETDSKGYTVTDNCGTTDAEKTDGVVTGNGEVDKTDWVITNTKAAVAPTGIAMTVAPYILMVSVAGIFAILFLRRRHEEA